MFSWSTQCGATSSLCCATVAETCAGPDHLEWGHRADSQFLLCCQPSWESSNCGRGPLWIDSAASSQLGFMQKKVNPWPPWYMDSLEEELLTHNIVQPHMYASLELNLKTTEYILHMFCNMREQAYSSVTYLAMASKCKNTSWTISAKCIHHVNKLSTGKQAELTLAAVWLTAPPDAMCLKTCWRNAHFEPETAQVSPLPFSQWNWTLYLYFKINCALLCPRAFFFFFFNLS